MLSSGEMASPVLKGENTDLGLLESESSATPKCLPAPLGPSVLAFSDPSLWFPQTFLTSCNKIFHFPPGIRFSCRHIPRFPFKSPLPTQHPPNTLPSTRTSASIICLPSKPCSWNDATYLVFTCQMPQPPSFLLLNTVYSE